MKTVLYSSFIISLLLTCAAAQPPIIFLVRHAERAPTSGHVPADTGLSATGIERARSLAQLLKDGKITAIYTSEYKRTRDTAAPLAELIGIRPQVIPAEDIRSLVATLRSNNGNVLLVGHSNTLPQIIAALGVTTHVTIAESDYDNLFLVLDGKPPQLIHLHYK